MNICVVGTGYVGLVVGTCFAENGNRVVGVDANPDKIRTLEEGNIPIYEPGLLELVRRNREEERLSFTTDLVPSVQQADVVFIAVGTPEGEDGSADLSHVLGVAKEIAAAMNGYKVVVLKSTVPVGTNKKVTAVLNEGTDHEFDVVSNPEFLKEGTALDDFMYPDRVVIGANSQRAADVMNELYSPFVRTGKPIYAMDPQSAEVTKYAANAMLATRISFMNEIARLCERVDANVNLVRQGIGSDSRIGFSFLFPGPGYGGSCFPKDVKALVKTASEVGYKMAIVQATEEVNADQKRFMVPKIVKRLGEDLSGKVIGVWGLAFKPRTDDMREAPSITMIEDLLARGATIRAFDPEAAAEAKHFFGDRITYCSKPMEAVEGADALVLVTEWNEFRRPDFEEMKQKMRSHHIFDCRNIYESDRLSELGFSYEGIGVPGTDG